MKAIFQQDGTLQTLDTTNETFIEGNEGINDLYAAFIGRPINAYPIATATFRRNDGSISPEINMIQATFTHNGTTYNGFRLNLYDIWFLAIPGKLDITCRLYSNNAIYATGKITISVQKSVTSGTTTITTTQYQNILQLLSQITTGNNVLTVTNPTFTTTSFGKEYILTEQQIEDYDKIIIKLTTGTTNETYFVRIPNNNKNIKVIYYGDFNASYFIGFSIYKLANEPVIFNVRREQALTASVLIDDTMNYYAVYEANSGLYYENINGHQKRVDEWYFGEI